MGVCKVNEAKKVKLADQVHQADASTTVEEEVHPVFKVHQVNQATLVFPVELVLQELPENKVHQVNKDHQVSEVTPGDEVTADREVTLEIKVCPVQTVRTVIQEKTVSSVMTLQLTVLSSLDTVKRGLFQIVQRTAGSCGMVTLSFTLKA